MLQCLNTDVLIKALDLCRNIKHGPRSDFLDLPLLNWKVRGTTGDENVARNRWPCRDAACSFVLGPLDADVEFEVHGSCRECRFCPKCDTSRHGFDVFELMEFYTSALQTRMRLVFGA